MKSPTPLNEVLSKRWRELRGLEIVSFGINSIKANEEDEAKIQKVQMGKTLSDPSLAMGAMADATSDSCAWRPRMKAVAARLSAS